MSAPVTQAAVLKCLERDDGVELRRLLTSSEEAAVFLNNTSFYGFAYVVSSVSLLHRACALGARSCVTVLIELGADPWVSSVVCGTAMTTGNAALDYCADAGTRHALTDAVRRCMEPGCAALLAQTGGTHRDLVAGRGAEAKGDDAGGRGGEAGGDDGGEGDSDGADSDDDDDDGDDADDDREELLAQ